MVGEGRIQDDAQGVKLWVWVDGASNIQDKVSKPYGAGPWVRYT